MRPIFNVDFHSHSLYSGDSLNRPEALIQMARRKGLDRLIITDHNTIRGALRARELAPDLIIVGEEIETEKGELLAAFVQEEIPAGLSYREAIRRLREQGSFISVSHPFDEDRTHNSAADLEEIAPLVDAFETFNARCRQERMNAQAEQFARLHNLPGTSGSDAHTLMEIGAAYLRLPAFTNADELRQSVRQAEPRGSRSPYWVHLFSRLAVLRHKLFPISLEK